MISLPSKRKKSKKTTHLLTSSGTVTNPIIIAKTARMIAMEANDRKKHTTTATTSSNHYKKQNPKSEHVKDLKKKFGFSRGRILRGLLISFMVFLGLGILSVGVLAVVGVNYYNSLPTISETDLRASEISVVYYKDGKTELTRYTGNQNRINVPLKDISQNMQYAIVALEQENFYKEGLPIWNLAGALRDCALKAGKNCRGASGLAQQLVKNVTGNDAATTERKIKELFLAQKLISSKSNDELLELYLNWVSFGKTIAGVEVAANSYFGKSAKDLTIPESCLIASMAKDPVNYENGIDARLLTESAKYAGYTELISRKNTCIEKLATLDLKNDGVKIVKSKEDTQELSKQELAFIDRKKDKKYPAWQDFVDSQLRNIFTDEELNKGGYKIVTSLDPLVQDSIEAIVQAQRSNFEQYANNAAAVVLDGPTGQIVAMVGSKDYNDTAIDGQVNVVTNARQAGSSFKPYVIANSLLQGFNPSTVINDTETDFGGGYKPKNFSKINYGLVTIASSLQNSLNVPLLKAAVFGAGIGNGDPYAGMKNVVATAEAMGVKYGDNPDETSLEHCRTLLSSAIGACPINMLSHATGFNTMGQDGTLRTATPFVEITAVAKGRTQEEADALSAEIKKKLGEVYPVKEASIKPEVARQMQNIMADTALRGLVYGSVANQDTGLFIPDWKGKIGAKTGTSTKENGDASDTWTAGYTKKYTAAIWVGNTKGEAIKCCAIGESLAMPIWNKIMRKMHENLNPADYAFSTEGLTKQNLSCPSGVWGPARTRCGDEWLTQEQIQKIKDFQKLSVNPAFNYLKSNIFEFRNEAFSVKRFFSKIDKKLVDSTKYPAELVEENFCTYIPSGFPENNGWNKGGSYKAPDGYNCKDFTDLDPTKIDVTITSNVASNANTPPTITVNVTTLTPSITIQKTSIKIDGNEVASAAGPAVSYASSTSGLDGNKSVVISTLDSLNRTKDVTFVNVKFANAPQPLTDGDISSITTGTCTNNTGTSGGTCSFVLPSNKIFPSGGKLKFSGAGGEFNCNPTSGTTVICTKAGGLTSWNSTNNPHTMQIKLSSGSFIDTQVKITL
jgi:membrane peptidoglycan carboxypeptidase